MVVVDEHLEEVDSVVLVLFGGVIPLSLQNGLEARVGAVVGA